MEGVTERPVGGWEGCGAGTAANCCWAAGSVLTSLIRPDRGGAAGGAEWEDRGGRAWVDGKDGVLQLQDDHEKQEGEDSGGTECGRNAIHGCQEKGEGRGGCRAGQGCQE